jgi:hypothetical protein
VSTKFYYKFLFWLVSTRLYLWAMKKVIPFIRFTTYYAIPENKKFAQWGPLERKGYARLQPGDLVFTIDKMKFSSMVIGRATAKLGHKKPLFTPSHIALCVAKGSEFEIAEMTHNDFTRSTWEDVTRGSTRVVIGRIDNWDKEYITDVVIPTTLSFSGKKYDDRFLMGEDSLACSELPYFADKERRAKVNLEPIIGTEPYITPVGWILADNIEFIWDSNAELNN